MQQVEWGRQLAICILIKYQGHGKIKHRHNAGLMPALVDVCGISALTGGEGFIHEVWAGGPLGDPGVGVTPAAVPVPCTRAPGRVCGRGGTQLPLATVLGRPAAILPPVKIGFSVVENMQFILWLTRPRIKRVGKFASIYREVLFKKLR